MKTLLIILALMLSSSMYAPLLKQELKIETKKEKKVVKKRKVKTHNDFLNAIGFRESSNRYNVVNKFGYMGKYQFGMSTLKGLGWNVSRQEFINSPDLQERAMDDLLKYNYRLLKPYIIEYNNKQIQGILITKSGVLAAAHLAGAGNVRKFFRKGYEFKDGNGTKMTSYMELFSGYELNL